MITARHKNLKGVNYDLPHVIAQAPPIEGPLIIPLPNF
jgi:caffeic acid 3-O-methyltransferase